jgi:nucleotide-binding universal stress UspA family protein
MKSALYSINNIVAATDFSANGELAALRAAYIAQQHGLILHLMHVAHPLDIYPELMITLDTHVKDYDRIKHANGIDLLDDLANTIRNDFNIDVRTSAHIGRSHVQIAAFAEENATNLIVVGFHGEKSMLDMVMGSTVFKLLRISPCPVLMVRNRGVVAYKEVIAAVDLTSASAQVASIAFAIAKKAHIELLHIYDLKQETLLQEARIDNEGIQKYRTRALEYIQHALNQILDDLDNQRVSSKVLNGYLPESIADCAKDSNADLVVMGNAGNSVLHKFLLGSVSEATSSGIDCDVLLVQ